MTIERFYDNGLAHASYAIVNGTEAYLVDPARNPQPYYDFVEQHRAKIVGIFETHPHADFVSSHLEISQTTGATIYVSTQYGADYPHTTFDHGQTLTFGDHTFECLHTPGHSPDSISILLRDSKGEEVAVFTGDTLFIGDVGRPDLRESVGNITAKKEALARNMYHSIHQILIPLADETKVFPAHGAGSLCGKALSADPFSTMGREKQENYALKPMDEDTFVNVLLKDQPFMPKYFGYNVKVNKQGAPAYQQSIDSVKRIDKISVDATKALVVDTRPEETFKKGHLKGALNIQQGTKFETWLGSIIRPDEQFYLIASDAAELEELIEKTAKIGYESKIIAASTQFEGETTTASKTNIDDFDSNKDAYTILDIRNYGERADGFPLANSLHIPLPELRERARELPADKPIVVHCAAGYRSAAGQSILNHVASALKVYDLSDAIKKYN